MHDPPKNAGPATPGEQGNVKIQEGHTDYFREDQASREWWVYVYEKNDCGRSSNRGLG